MRRWVPFSAGLAPTVLIGGWTLAASRQRGGFDQVRDTISALAAHGADDRWLMTGALAALGAAHVATAAGLEEAAPAGRVVLAFGGVTAALVAAFPQPSAGHFPAATASFVALAVWPAAVRAADAGRRSLGDRRPRRAPAAGSLASSSGTVRPARPHRAGGGRRRGAVAAGRGRSAVRQARSNDAMSMTNR